MKKFLSVALALAMTLSLVVVGASAKDFTDNSKVNYKEAVDVISGIGVVNGYSDGDFKPTNTLTRGAAAKIICNLMLGPTAADAMGVSKAPFKDVSVKNVFSGYIAYCSTQGIINGYRDGTFRPSGTVTGFQFLKMLLGALGYDGSIQGFTGKNWTVNVAQLVIKTGLTDGNDSFVGSKAMTREEATLYALNLLKTPMVEYASKGTKITQPDGSVISIGASAAKAVESTKKTIKDDTYLEFGEQYFPKLELDLTNTTDDFGRAANHWTYKNVDIGTYPTDTDVVVRYTASTTKSKVAKDLKGYNVSSLTKAEVYVNGKQEGASGASAIVANVTGTNGIEDLTGNGRIVEVYSDGKDINKIVVINYVLGKVTAVSDTNETITVKDQTSSSSNSYTSEAGYGDYAKNSYVMIAPKASTLNADGTVATYLTGSTSGNEALAVAPVTKISGKITSVKQNDSAVVGGKTYESAANYVDSTFNPTVSDSATVAVYLDSYGYIVSCDATAAAGNYLLVTKVSWKTTDSLGNDVYKMQAVFTDGTSGVYTVSKLNGDTVADATDAGNNKIKFDSVKVGLYSYTVSGSKYELTSAESSNTSANYGHVWDEAKTSSITNSTVKLNSQYFADDVNYIVVTNNGDSDMKVSQYTGKQNTAGDVAVYYLTSKSVETDQNGTITTAFVVGSDVVSSNSDVIFTTASQAASNGSAIIDGTRYTTYSVYMNGEKTTIPVKGDTIPSANKFYTYGKDSNGVYALNDTDSGVKTDKVVSAYNKYVTVADITDTLTATDDIKVVDTRSDVDTKIDSLSALADADGSVIASVVYNGDKNTVSYIYVTGVKSNACEMTALKINGSDAKLYTSAADAASGDKVSVAKDTAITLSGIAKSDDATAAYTYDGDYSSTFTSDGTLESGVTKTTAAGGCTDVVCIVVTAQDGKTSNTYYTAIEVGA